jgi:hypothetical protein
MRKMISAKQADIERVYKAIYDHLTQTHNLPTYGRLAQALRMNKDSITACVEKLREAKRIEPNTLLPTDFGLRWRDLPPLRDPLTAEWFFGQRLESSPHGEQT